MKLLRKFRNFINNEKTLEDKFFAVVLMVGIGIVFGSIIVTLAENMTLFANIGSASAGVMLLAVFFVAYHMGRRDVARLMLCYILNCFVIPMSFFSCGGIDSGMPLYMVAGIFLLVPVLKGKARRISILIAFLTHICCILLSFYCDQTPSSRLAGIIVTKLDPQDRVFDMICSLILIGLYIVLTTFLIMDAYQKEREGREKLLAKLDDLSKRDELTGLFNRRELFAFLETMPVLKEGDYYLYMIDLDHFKNINDTYGHLFGDAVLRRLATILTEEIASEKEIAARYGGEEFLLLMKADEIGGAKDRAERIRRKFEEEKWEEAPKLVTTLSCGLVHCSEYSNFQDAISSADKLLYEAKESGRNRVKA